MNLPLQQIRSLAVAAQEVQEVVEPVAFVEAAGIAAESAGLGELPFGSSAVEEHC